MNEVAESTPHAPFSTIEPTACFAEVGHRGKLAVDGACGIPAAVKGVTGGLSRVFVFEPGVDITD